MLLISRRGSYMVGAPWALKPEPLTPRAPVPPPPLTLTGTLRSHAEQSCPLAALLTEVHCLRSSDAADMCDQRGRQGLLLSSQAFVSSALTFTVMLCP